MIYSPNKYRETEGRIGDYAKTLWLPEPPKEINKIIKSYTKLKVPNFFIYAKDKEEHQVEAPNNSVMNRIAAHIPNYSKIRFCKTISKFDYRILMNLDADFSISEDNPVIKSYDYWNVRQRYFSEDDKHIKASELYCFQQMRNKIIEETKKPIDYIVNTLVAFLYTGRKTSAKKGLWECFGDVILQNIQQNLQNKGKICPICGKRFIPSRQTQKCCSKECGEIQNRERYFQKF